MSTFFLVRHATHALLGRALAGRIPGVGIDRKGRQQAERVAQRLVEADVTHLQSSPRQRALETAEPIGRRLGLAVEIVPALDEVDFGAWSGRSFASLAVDPAWHAWNARRSAARPPGGETMQELQERALRHLEWTARRIPRGRVALVSHAETIRAVVMHCLGTRLDDFARIEIEPASITVVETSARGCEVVDINRAAAA